MKLDLTMMTQFSAGGGGRACGLTGKNVVEVFYRIIFCHLGKNFVTSSQKGHKHVEVGLAVAARLCETSWVLSRGVARQDSSERKTYDRVECM